MNRPIVLIALLVILTGCTQISPTSTIQSSNPTPAVIATATIEMPTATIRVSETSSITPLPVSLPSPTSTWTLTLNIIFSPTATTGAGSSSHSGCQIQGAYPDPACTPGAAFNVTKEQVCTSGYSSTVRDVSETEKNQVFAEYGITVHNGTTYEVDHFISLELGGSNDITNLWPEPASPLPGFHEKDKVENYLHEQVCNGNMTLEQAQSLEISDWVEVYNSMGKVINTPLPPLATATYEPVTYPTATTGSSGGHPANTTGQCKDGTYTNAQHKQGACSHHGGVAQWWGP